MYYSRKQQTADERDAVRAQREREDSAPRLQEMFPKLRSMRLHIAEVGADGRHVSPPYSRLIVMQSAPAMFAVRCIEPRCSGRHEITAAVLAGLRSAAAHTQGESPCDGMRGDVACSYTMRYAFDAEFQS